ncbi:helix-turn-helix domain-containing protein [Aerococcus sp. UMB7834]|uniref:response regulator transcription factor n=1 Tax=Aerococcus sp. UMB7834 TaxID=3046342 RepID=UPI0025513577|nr:helix-turn-helix domain-containing protein [Aerococcus sp. UMB7834]MDK6805122.1 helix-turn-helix domain-containing protein [Aerococcus sp. UMB7834]
MYRIVIVEDEEWIRKWLVYGVDYAQLGGVVVGEASNGKEGAALIRDSRPDLVLTDITMPVMGAFEMFDAVADLSFEKIIISGYNDFANAKEAIRYGVVDFVTKPIDEGELLASVQAALDRLQPEAGGEGLADELLVGLVADRDALVQEVLAYVHAHFKEKLTMARMAKALGYSESYLYRKIKVSLTVSLSDYIQRYRIAQAVQVLEAHSDIRIADLATDLGFSDYNYFDQVFKKYVGMTPTAFRKGIRDEK